MLPLDRLKTLTKSTPSKIILVVIDGLGGLPNPHTGKTELETASTPNLDNLASKGICGFTEPISPGVTPGSGPGHLGLFGYDPLQYSVGRGILEVVGIDFDVKKGDVAARGNFCTVDKGGLVVDRRAGRISTEKSVRLCELLNSIRIDGAQFYVLPVREHRFALVLRGEDFSGDVSDSDPQALGVPPSPIEGSSPGAQKVAHLANRFVEEAKRILKPHYPANMVLLRGFSQHPDLPSMGEILKLKPAAIAAYPMYRGLARLAGMTALDTDTDIKSEFQTLARHYDGYDFFFVHIKPTDSAGEDGDFDRKVFVLEEIDRLLPLITALEPDVLVVAGDHSTPALLRGHSWHPVPVLLSSPYCRPDTVKEFSEEACLAGGLGRLPAVEIMPLAMAHALKLEKFGA
ncbi:MAG: 2,3-bisphosphoglycerate-independent phosphoglycerate mutase [Dehalococcoidia bacterium]|nr:2,3-bisphosphoglycerate-independent phosphoglycerate mutase [Dehalococcoidia bacterium]